MSHELLTPSLPDALMQHTSPDPLCWQRLHGLLATLRAVMTRSQQAAASKITAGTLTRAQRKKLQKLSSKYEIWYTLGVINCNWELYLIDWCYVVNYISETCAILAALRVGFGIVTPLVKYNADLIRAEFSMACGPLASSIYLFRNSIVFFDVDHSTSVFIHLMAPFIFFWDLKFGAGFGPGIVNEKFPEMFMVCGSKEQYDAADDCMKTWRGALWCDACSAPLSSFVVPAALLYICVWAVPYFLCIFIWWRDWIKDTGKETLYTYLLQTNPSLESLFQKYFGWCGETYAGPVGSDRRTKTEESI